MKTIAITGHRPNKLGGDYELQGPKIKVIKDTIIGILVSNSPSFTINNTEKKIDGLKLITGMALGIDTLFAQIAIEYNIPFIGALPCWGQDAVWPNRSRSLYHEILNNDLCEQYVVHKGYYTDTCMQERNKWMVDNLGEDGILIAVWDNSNGGTANCVKYFVEKQMYYPQRELIIINPKEI